MLDGAHIADEIKREVADDVARLISNHGVRPGLVVVQVGDDPASTVYVGNKVRTSRELGLLSEHQHLAAETTTEQLLELVMRLNERETVDGLLVQLPLPRGVDEARVLEALDPSKDVDGFHPINVGRLSLGQPRLAPCTPAGIVELLVRCGIEIGDERRMAVVATSWATPAQLLLQHDATVICHSRTRDSLPLRAGGHSGRRHRARGLHSRGAHQAGRDRDRCRHEQGDG